MTDGVGAVTPVLKKRVLRVSNAWKERAQEREQRMLALREAKKAAAARKPKTPLKPSQCVAHMRKRLAEEFPGIVEGFVKEAKSGSCPHVKLASELLKTTRKPARKKSAAERMLEELSGVRSGPGKRVRGEDGAFVGKKAGSE